MSGLKSCPFCGGLDLYEIKEEDKYGFEHPKIFCNSCKISVEIEDDSNTLNDNARMTYLKAKVIDAWNRRANDQTKTTTATMP